ncbi:hypothetical protein BGZ73_005088 [Actinomortierella ambigua]|nr:hypothetical protein BGZ73_005088 [Actinomortierella ambigua]
MTPAPARSSRSHAISNSVTFPPPSGPPPPPPGTPPSQEIQHQHLQNYYAQQQQQQQRPNASSSSSSSSSRPVSYSSSSHAVPLDLGRPTAPMRHESGGGGSGNLGNGSNNNNWSDGNWRAIFDAALVKAQQAVQLDELREFGLAAQLYSQAANDLGRVIPMCSSEKKKHSMLAIQAIYLDRVNQLKGTSAQSSGSHALDAGSPQLAPQQQQQQQYEYHPPPPAHQHQPLQAHYEEDYDDQGYHASSHHHHQHSHYQQQHQTHQVVPQQFSAGYNVSSAGYHEQQHSESVVTKEKKDTGSRLFGKKRSKTVSHIQKQPSNEAVGEYYGDYSQHHQQDPTTPPATVSPVFMKSSPSTSTSSNKEKAKDKDESKSSRWRPFGKKKSKSFSNSTETAHPPPLDAAALANMPPPIPQESHHFQQPPMPLSPTHPQPPQPMYYSNPLRNEPHQQQQQQQQQQHSYQDQTVPWYGPSGAHQQSGTPAAMVPLQDYEDDEYMDPQEVIDHLNRARTFEGTKPPSAKAAPVEPPKEAVPETRRFPPLKQSASYSREESFSPTILQGPYQAEFVDAEEEMPHYDHQVEPQQKQQQQYVQHESSYHQEQGAMEVDGYDQAQQQQQQDFAFGDEEEEEEEFDEDEELAPPHLPHQLNHQHSTSALSSTLPDGTTTPAHGAAQQQQHAQPSPQDKTDEAFFAGDQQEMTRYDELKQKRKRTWFGLKKDKTKPKDKEMDKEEREREKEKAEAAEAQRVQTVAKLVDEAMFGGGGSSSRKKKDAAAAAGGAGAGASLSATTTTSAAATRSTLSVHQEPPLGLLPLTREVSAESGILSAMNHPAFTYHQSHPADGSMPSTSGLAITPSPLSSNTVHYQPRTTYSPARSDEASPATVPTASGFAPEEEDESQQSHAHASAATAEVQADEILEDDDEPSHHSSSTPGSRRPTMTTTRSASALSVKSANNSPAIPRFDADGFIITDAEGFVVTSDAAAAAGGDTKSRAASVMSGRTGKSGKSGEDGLPIDGGVAAPAVPPTGAALSKSPSSRHFQMFRLKSRKTKKLKNGQGIEEGSETAAAPGADAAAAAAVVAVVPEEGDEGVAGDAKSVAGSSEHQTTMTTRQSSMHSGVEAKSTLSSKKSSKKKGKPESDEEYVPYVYQEELEGPLMERVEVPENREIIGFVMPIEVNYDFSQDPKEDDGLETWDTWVSQLESFEKVLSDKGLKKEKKKKEKKEKEKKKSKKEKDLPAIVNSDLAAGDGESTITSSSRSSPFSSTRYNRSSIFSLGRSDSKSRSSMFDPYNGHQHLQGSGHSPNGSRPISFSTDALAMSTPFGVDDGIQGRKSFQSSSSGGTEIPSHLGGTSGSSAFPIKVQQAKRRWWDPRRRETISVYRTSTSMHSTDLEQDKFLASLLNEADLKDARPSLELQDGDGGKHSGGVAIVFPGDAQKLREEQEQQQQKKDEEVIEKAMEEAAKAAEAAAAAAALAAAQQEEEEEAEKAKSKKKKADKSKKKKMSKKHDSTTDDSSSESEEESSESDSSETEEESKKKKKNKKSKKSKKKASKKNKKKAAESSEDDSESQSSSDESEDERKHHKTKSAASSNAANSSSSSSKQKLLPISTPLAQILKLQTAEQMWPYIQQAKGYAMARMNKGDKRSAAIALKRAQAIEARWQELMLELASSDEDEDELLSDDDDKSQSSSSSDSSSSSSSSSSSEESDSGSDSSSYRGKRSSSRRRRGRKSHKSAKPSRSRSKSGSNKKRSSKTKKGHDTQEATAAAIAPAADTTASEVIVSKPIVLISAPLAAVAEEKEEEDLPPTTTAATSQPPAPTPAPFVGSLGPKPTLSDMMTLTDPEELKYYIQRTKTDTVQKARSGSKFAALEGMKAVKMLQARLEVIEAGGNPDAPESEDDEDDEDEEDDDDKSTEKEKEKETEKEKQASNESHDNDSDENDKNPDGQKAEEEEEDTAKAKVTPEETPVSEEDVKESLSTPVTRESAVAETATSTSDHSDDHKTSSTA